MSTLEVDAKGLARKLAHRPKSFILLELVSNAWDEDVKNVTISLEMLKGRPVCNIKVIDDCPTGFADMTSIYTMFKDSKKADNPTQRGRFELGEKLILALALRAAVHTTKGSVLFEEGNRKSSTRKTSQGSVFEGDFRMTREEYAEVVEAVSMLAPPEHIRTEFNGKTLEPRTPVHTFRTSLATIRADGEGNLSPTQRMTEVKVYETRPGEVAHIFEMGIPVVATGDKWHYDVQQKVPVNWERNNVPPSYLKTLRVEVLNAMSGELDEEASLENWVSDALEDARCDAAAVQTVVTNRFGDRAVIADPSDPEGTKIAASKGFSVITGGAFSKGAWENIRKAGAVLPAGQVTPSPKPYSPDGREEKVIPEADWTFDMQRLASFSDLLFQHLIGHPLQVVIVNEPKVSWLANFGDRRLCLNYGRLGKAWFAREKRDPKVLDLLLHEYCHTTCLDHLSHEMHETATRLGAKLANIALDHPNLFKES